MDKNGQNVIFFTILKREFLHFLASLKIKIDAKRLNYKNQFLLFRYLHIGNLPSEKGHRKKWMGNSSPVFCKVFIFEDTFMSFVFVFVFSTRPLYLCHDIFKSNAFTRIVYFQKFDRGLILCRSISIVLHIIQNICFLLFKILCHESTDLKLAFW